MSSESDPQFISNSLEGTLEIIKENDIENISLCPAIVILDNGVALKGFGCIGKYVFSTTYSARTLNGKEIIFMEIHYHKNGGEYDASSAKEIEDMSTKGIITSYSRLESIKQRFQNIRVKMINSEHNKFNENFREKIFVDASKKRITPF